jgi:tetratricopeptide (TPR) repeat protein
MDARKRIDNTVDAERVVGPVVQAGSIGTVNLSGPPARTAAAVVLPVRSELAADADVFVGREEEAGRLSCLLRPGSGAVVSYVAGMGGVGKTALALHCARAAVKWFRGGVFSVDMQGYRAEGGVFAESVLRPITRLLGVDPLDIPADVGEQVVAYQQVLGQLGQSGKAVLLVLDNVSTADQIRGLVPAHGAHRVLITTRDTLDLRKARGFSLDVPTAEKATVLLDEALRDRASGDRRFSVDPIGTRELVRTCGRLPLALRIAAALLAEEPGLTPTQLATELTEAGIVSFAHGEWSLAAVLDLSWHRLLRRNRAAARLLRLLCLTVGPDCPTEVAAVLNDSSNAHTLPLLRMLRQAHLLAHTDQRWRMHDLVRAHTETHDAGLVLADLDAANLRLVNHYGFTTQDAVVHITAPPDKPIHNRFSSGEDALHWLHTEYHTLLAVARKAAESGNHRHAMVLCSQLNLYQEKYGYLTDQLMTSHLGYASAGVLGDLAEQADMANNLGIALKEVGRRADAIDLYKIAIELHTRNGNIYGAAKAWNNLGVALKDVGRRGEAVRACRAAVDAYLRTGDARKEAGAWSNLGGALATNGQAEEAADAHEKAAELYQEIGDHENVAMAWTRVANVLLDAGLPDEAIEVNHSAIKISKATANTTAEASVWSSLGFIYERLGRASEADDAYRRSIDLEGHKQPSGKVAQRWTRLGHARDKEGNLVGAAAAHQEAVRVYHQIGDWHGEAMTSNNLGHVRMKLGDRQGAADAHQVALNLARTHNDLFGQAMTLANIGAMHHKTRDTADAVIAFYEATDLFHRIRDTDHEAGAWLHLGICLHDNDPAQAVVACRKALTLYTESNNMKGMRSAAHRLEISTIGDQGQV